MKTLPQSPEQLLESLFAIFPEFRASYTDEGDGFGGSTYHSILLDFTPFFGGRIDAFSEAQLRSFGVLVSNAVEKEGKLENAFSTGFLEHLHQIKAGGVFFRYLTTLAQQKTHA